MAKHLWTPDSTPSKLRERIYTLAREAKLNPTDIEFQPMYGHRRPRNEWYQPSPVEARVRYHASLRALAREFANLDPRTFIPPAQGVTSW